MEIRPEIRYNFPLADRKNPLRLPAERLMRPGLFGVLLLAALTTAAESAQEKKPEPQEAKTQEVLVTGRSQDLTGVADSATEGKISQKELQNRPIQRAGEVLETVPGLIVTQHSGSGKANQYFLRGFNLDH